MGTDGVMRGRKLGARELQLLVLVLLTDSSVHGYDLIRLIGERSGGAYKPSPGVIYPALATLESEQLVSVTSDSRRKRYTQTDAGRSTLAERDEEVQYLLRRLRHMSRKMASIHRALSGESDENPEIGDAWLTEFSEARRALKQLLFDKTDASHDEQRRIAAILRQAADDIRNLAL